MRLTDAGAPLAAGEGCSAESDGVICPYPQAPGGPIVELNLLDGNDSAFIDDNAGFHAQMHVFGGLGNDTLHVGGSNPGPLSQTAGRATTCFPPRITMQAAQRSGGVPATTS